VAAQFMMRKLTGLIPLLAAIAVVALGSAPAAGADATRVIADCNTNGYLTGHYSRAELQSALNGMGADVREYTNCYDVISRALAGVAAAGKTGGGGRGGSGGASGGGFGAPGGTGVTGGGFAGVSTRGVYSRAPVAAAAGPGSQAPVVLSGTPVSPTSSGVSGGSDGRSLPAALIVVLAVLAASAAGVAGVAVRRRWASSPGSGEGPGSFLRRLARQGR
jgi:hypothetical protein